MAFEGETVDCVFTWDVADAVADADALVGVDRGCELRGETRVDWGD